MILHTEIDKEALFMKKMFALFLTFILMMSIVPASMADDVTNVNVWSIYTGDDFRIIHRIIEGEHVGTIFMNHPREEFYWVDYLQNMRHGE